MATPLFLRDLTPEQQAEWVAEINASPKLRREYEAGEDIVVGHYLKHPRTYDEEFK